MQAGAVAIINPTEYTCSQGGPLSVVTGALRRYIIGRPKTITKIKAAVGTAPTGAAILFDIRKNGVANSIMNADQSIAAGANTLTISAIDHPELADGDYLTLDIKQVGNIVAGSDLTITIVC